MSRARELIDCASRIAEPEAAAILETYRKSETLLPNLRIWMSTLRVGEIIVTGMRHDALALAEDFAKVNGVANAPLAK